jgi:hypothetical protein
MKKNPRRFRIIIACLSALVLATCTPPPSGEGDAVTPTTSPTPPTWKLVGPSGFSGSAIYPLLSFHGTTPYVSFGDCDNGTKATVMKWSGGTWTVLGSRGFSAGQVNRTSLALDTNGVPYVAFQDQTTHQAVVMRYSNSGATGWELVGAADFSPSAMGGVFSLALDSHDVPYLAFCDSASGYAAAVMKHTGSGATGWQLVGAIGISSGQANGVSLRRLRGFPARLCGECQAL